MTRNVFAVFSKRPDGVSAEEYDAWYFHHARENLDSPGLLRAERFGATLTSGPATERGSEWHLALYEFEGDPAVWRADLKERIAGGAIELPEWFPQIDFRSWICLGIESGIEPAIDPPAG